MPYSEESVLSTIDAIYSASTDSTKWSAALGEMAKLFGARAMTLLHRHSDGAGFVFAAADMDPHLMDLYDQYYWALDPSLKAAETLPVGSFHSSDQICPKEEYDRSEFVTDLMVPNGLFRVGGSVLVRSETAFASLGLHRPRHLAEFDDIEPLYQEIQPHLQRALTINRILGRQAAERDALAQSLDHISNGVVVLDVKGSIIRVNRAASEIVAEEDGFALTRSGLAGATAADTAILRQRIAEAAKPASGAGSEFLGAVLLERPSGKRPYAVLASPLTGPGAMGSEQPGCVAVFISNPERESTPPVEWLRHLYGFTQAEAGLVMSLANGSSLTEIAERCHVTRNTIRTHLQRAMTKTDTRRQGELIRLVLMGPAGLVEPERA